MKTENYFNEAKLLRILQQVRQNPSQSLYDELYKILYDLNIRVVNKKLPYYSEKYNLVVQKVFQLIEKEDIMSEIFLQQLSQLSRYEIEKGRLFSFLTQIQENVIKYRVQNLVKETNYIVYLENAIQKNKNTKDDSYNSPDEFMKVDIEFESELDDELENMTTNQMYSEYEDFQVLYDKMNELIHSLKTEKNKQLQVMKIILFNKFLVFYKYRKKKKNTKKIFDYLFEIEKKIKKEQQQTQMFFGFKKIRINSKVLYELFGSGLEKVKT